MAKTIVVGAGIGGLAGAIRLQARGHQVQLIEANGQPGGRAQVFKKDGFVFDAGPTVIRHPTFSRNSLNFASVIGGTTMNWSPWTHFIAWSFKTGPILITSAILSAS